MATILTKIGMFDKNKKIIRFIARLFCVYFYIIIILKTVFKKNFQSCDVIMLIDTIQLIFSLFTINN